MNYSRIFFQIESIVCVVDWCRVISLKINDKRINKESIAKKIQIKMSSKLITFSYAWDNYVYVIKNMQQ